MIVIGLVLAVIPLALWVAWSESVFFAVLALLAVATVVFIALARPGPEEQAPPRVEPRQILSDDFIAELHRLVPFTYHHRRLGDTRLRGKFAKLRALMRRPGI